MIGTGFNTWTLSVIAELRQSVETIVLHNLFKDLNDLLSRVGYPPIHFSIISAALEEEHSHRVDRRYQFRPARPGAVRWLTITQSTIRGG